VITDFYLVSTVGAIDIVRKAVSGTTARVFDGNYCSGRYDLMYTKLSMPSPFLDFTYALLLKLKVYDLVYGQ